jgi:RimJ/RimL family protein N-acetyltransferase
MADPILMRHMGRERFSYEEAEAALERHLHHWDRHGFGLWAAEDKQTGELIGRVGLSYHRLWPHDPEVGWLIDTPWQGRGLATEAGAASIRYAFEHLGVERIVSICTPENASSRRVMARLGLRRIRDLDDPELGIRLWLHALDRAGLPP